MVHIDDFESLAPTWSPPQRFSYRVLAYSSPDLPVMGMELQTWPELDLTGFGTTSPSPGDHALICSGPQVIEAHIAGEPLATRTRTRQLPRSGRHDGIVGRLLGARPRGVRLSQIRADW